MCVSLHSVGVPNLNWRPTALSISHCSGEAYLELQLRCSADTSHTHTPTPPAPTTSPQRQRSKQTVEWGQGIDAWTKPGKDVMREMMWESRHFFLKKGRTLPMEELWLSALPSWLLCSLLSLAFFAQFSYTLLSLTPRVSAPASSSLTPSSSPQPSQPRRSSSIIRSSTCPSPSAFFFFFYFYLLFHTVILEGLRRPASLSQHTNAAIQRIKERICWLRQKPFPCLLITKWSPDYRGWEEREARYSIIAVIDDIHINIYPLNTLWFGAGLRLNPVH